MLTFVKHAGLYSFIVKSQDDDFPNGTSFVLNKIGQFINELLFSIISPLAKLILPRRVQSGKQLPEFFDVVRAQIIIFYKVFFFFFYVFWKMFHPYFLFIFWLKISASPVQFFFKILCTKFIRLFSLAIWQYLSWRVLFILFNFFPWTESASLQPGPYCHLAVYSHSEQGILTEG